VTVTNTSLYTALNFSIQVITNGNAVLIAAPDFSEQDNCGTSVAAGASCVVNVFFTPTQAGSRTGSVNFAFAGSVAAQVPTVSLSGTGLAPQITPSTTSFTFAPQLINTSSQAQVLTLTNTGNVSATLTGFTVSGDFAQTNTCGTSLAPGNSCTVSITFTPTVRGGALGTLEANFGSITFVSLTGTGQAILAAATPGSLSFAPTPLNTSSPAQTITFTNTGDLPATVSGVSISGDYAQTNTCGASLAVGANCSVSVTFTPTARGSRTGTVTVQGNFTSAPPVINLSGTGQAFIASLTPASFDFGSVPVSTSSSSQAFTYSNTGDLPLTVSSVSVAADFNQTNNCPASLAVNTSCSINVTFAPRSTGTQTANLAGSGSAAASASLTGTGVMPLATISPASLSFGNQRVGTSSAPQVVTVTNSGAYSFFVNDVSYPAAYTITSNCFTSIAPGASCTVNVVFAPANLQPAAGVLTIAGDFTATPSSVSLSGTPIASTATLSPTSLTFASQIVGTVSPAQTLTLSNTGNVPNNLTAIQATGDFVQTNNCGAALAVGATCTISVSFAPTVHGSRSGAITVSGDFTSAAPSASLTGTGTTPVAAWSPASLNFANQLVGNASNPQVVTLSNTGDGPLTISGITASGDFAQTNSCGATLAAGGNCNINVTFVPTTTGARTGSLSLNSNSSVAVSSITLAGTGLAPDATLSASTLTFPAQLIFTASLQQSVTLTNSGNAALSVTAIKATGDFTQTNNCPGNVAPGASCTINVTFTPTASGARSGALTITDNAISGGTQTVSLSGTCLAPAAALSPASLSFGNQLVNTASTAQIATLSNPGTAALGINSIGVTGDYSQSNNCGSSLAAGASCSINLVFTPIARGARSGALNVSAAAAGGNGLQVTLSGSGIGPVASLSSSSLAFAAQLVNTTSALQAVTLTNSGDATMNVSAVLLTGDFAQTTNCIGTVLPGASCTVNVTFTPTTTGTRSGTLTISADAINGGAQFVSVTGTGVAPAAVLSPSTLTFPSQLVGTSSASQSVTLSNPGTATLVINTISVSGDYSQSNNCGSSLAAGASCSINVIFTPAARGARSGALSVGSSASGSAPTASLNGTGIAPVAVFSPNTIGFGNQRVATPSAAQSATLSNNGDAALSMNGFLVTGSSDFTQTNNCPASLAPGQNCVVSVVFTPSSRGSKAATISVNTQPLFSTSASLSGTGIAPVASLPSSLDFGPQNLGTTPVQTITLANLGELPLSISSINTSNGTYSQSNSCGGSVAAGGSCAIQVTFHANALGVATGSLTVTDNDPAGGTQVTSLTGTGVDFSVSASPVSVTVTAGQTAGYTVSIASLGGSFPNSVSLACNGLPAGTTCTFSPASLVPGANGASSALAITTSNGQNGTRRTPRGSHGITVSAVSGNLKHNVSLTLVVQ
jgi:hypothetical protein